MTKADKIYSINFAIAEYLGWIDLKSAGRLLLPDEPFGITGIKSYLVPIIGQKRKRDKVPNYVNDLLEINKAIESQDISFKIKYQNLLLETVDLWHPEGSDFYKVHMMSSDLRAILFCKAANIWNQEWNF